MADLKKPGLIYLKGFLFAAIVVCVSTILMYRNPDWQTALLVLLLIWAAARTYYFMFYVIENYVDKNYKFSGVASFLRHIIRNRKQHKEST